MGVKTKGLKGVRRLKANVRDWTSLASWFLFVTNGIGKFANQSAILFYTCFELVCSCFAVWFFLSFKEVALNGWMLTRWKVYVICSSFRLVCSLLGFMAAYLRKIRIMRYYYAAILPNIVFTIVATVPLVRTKCHCVNFIDCQVLISFMQDDRIHMVNPHPPPNHERWDQRAVPYEDPPTEEQATRLWRLPMMNMALLQESATLQRPFAQQAKTQKVTQPNPAMVHMHYLNDFTPTSPHLQWVSTERHCFDVQPNDPDLGLDFKKSLETLQSMKPMQINVFKPKWNDMFVHHLGDSLHHCVQDPRCGVLHLLLFEGMLFKVCQLSYPTVPIPTKDVVKTKFKSSIFSMYLQKHHIKADKDFESTITNAVAEQLETKPPEVAWDRLKYLIEDSCRCNPRFPKPEASGCQVWHDGNRWRSWCIVEERSLAACIKSGIAVFKQDVDGQPDYYWSEDLCRKRSCKCSGLGLPPVPTNEGVVKDQLIGQYGFNYGKSCKKWDAEDEEQWCYVGYDTTCPDRRKDIVEITRTDGQSERLTQYYSAYACVADKQHGMMRSYQDRCQIYIRTVAFVLIALNVVSLPMFIVVFKFLMNRCGDHFNVDDQFVAQFSSEEEYDDFDIAADETSASFKQDRPLKSALKKTPQGESEDTSATSTQEKTGSEEKLDTLGDSFYT